MATATLVTTNITTLDDADSSTQWSADRNLTGPDTELYKESTGSMGCTIQAATNADEIFITKTSGVWDLSNTHIRLWLFFTAVGQLYSDASGGIQISVDDGTNKGLWYVSGSDTYLGGWKLLQVDTRLAVDAGTKPTDMTQITDVGVRVYLTSSPKNAQNLWTDMWHETDDGYEVHGGTSGDPITWADIAAADDTNGYGIVQEIDGVYFVSGPIQIGSGTNTTYFEWTTETVIFVDNKVDAAYYDITFYGANTNVDITGGSVQAIADRFDFWMNDSTLVGTQIDVDGLNFLLADNTTFKADIDVTNCKWVDCNQVDAGGANLSDCTFANSTDTGGAFLFPADSTKVSGLTFLNCDNGVEYDATSDSTTPTFTDFVFDDEAGNYDVNNTSGSAVTITQTGSSNANSYNSGGSTVTFVSTKTLSVHVEDDSGNDIQYAQVYMNKATPDVYTSASGNNAGDADFVVTEAIAADCHSTNGWIFVTDVSTGDQHPYRYASVNTGTKTFTFNTEVTGTDNGTGDSTTINETNIGTKDIVEGDTIRNTTDTQWAIVRSVSTNSVTTTPLSGGASWASDNYSVHKLAVSYSTSDTAITPIINGETDATGDITQTFNYQASPLDINVKIRYSPDAGTKYLPYKTSGQITGDYSLTAVLIEDNIAT